MGQMGFFDLGNRYSGLDAKNEPLLKIDGVVPWEDLTLLPDPGPGGKLNTDLEGRDDKADEAAIFAGIQGTVGCPAVGAGCDA